MTTGMASLGSTDVPRLLQVFSSVGMLKVQPRPTDCICGPLHGGQRVFYRTF